MLIVLATGLSFLQVLGLTATLGEPASILCAEGAECPTPPASIETAFGSFNAWEMSEDQFNRYRIELIVFTFVAEMIIALFLVKTLRDQETERKTLK